MRAALFVALVVACENHGITHDSQPHRFVEQLTASDHGELIRLEGSVSKVVVHGKHPEPHSSFQLAHGGQTVTVVSKAIMPVLFREGAPAVVLGRWVETTTKIRADLNDEDFANVTGPEVFLAREVFAMTPSF
jgi:cytochrome c-type biogenesis protein CcmE